MYLFYPVLKQHIQYEFEPCDNDTVDKITADHASAVVSLSKEAKRWAARIARETNNIREYTRKLHIFQQLRDSGQKVMCEVQLHTVLSSLRGVAEIVVSDGSVMHVQAKNFTEVCNWHEPSWSSLQNLLSFIQNLYTSCCFKLHVLNCNALLIHV